MLHLLSRDFLIKSLIAACFIMMESCVVSKKSVYFRDLQDSQKVVSIVGPSFEEPIIQADDILSVSVQTIDPTNSSAINQVSSLAVGNISPNTLFENKEVPGFLVDKDGTITMAMVGKVKVAGLTTFKARDLIRERVSKFYKDPVVQVRFANYKVTVIGEVTRPATYTLPNEKVTLLDAIGLAGDLTIYGKRENVLLIRDNNGIKEFARLNLNSSEVFRSPYFYLKQNDVIYVEPGKGKIAANNASRTQIFAVIGSILSVLIVAFTRI